MKFSTAIRRFDEQLRADGKLSITRSIYIRDLRLLKTWLGNDPNITKITPQTLTRFLTSKAFTHTENGKRKAIISLNRAKSAYRSFFRFLVEAGHLKQNPARLVRFASITRKPPSYLTDTEIKKLLAILKHSKTQAAKRDHVMFSILIGTGIRLGSLVGLNTSNVNLNQGFIRINGKGNNEQLVFLNANLKRLIKSYLRERSIDPDNPLFTSIRGRRIGTRQVQLRLDYWLDLAGITRPCTIHTLRHTFATRLYEKTGDLRLVQRALGHKHITTTEIYTHIADAKLKRAVQSLGTLG